MRRWMVLLVCANAVLMTAPISVLGDMGLPTFEAGDQWVYSVNLRMEGMATLAGQWTYQVQGEIQTSGHQVYDVSLSGVGDATIEGTLGSLEYTLDGFTHIRVSDLATVKESMMLDFNTSTYFPGTYFSAFMNMTYDPPLNQFDFPIKEGDTWSTTSSLTLGIDIVSNLVETNSTSATVSVSTDFEVESKETVEVVAGKFMTHKIKATEADGNITYTYMSTKSGYMVKTRLYDSTGASVGTMSLKSYSYTLPQTGDDGLLSDLMDLWLVFVILIVVFLVLIGLLLSRRKKRELDSQIEEQPEEQEGPPPG
jgi:hypothetical protein